MAKPKSNRKRQFTSRLWLLVPFAGLVLHNVAYFPVAESHTQGARTSALTPLSQRDVLALALSNPNSNSAHRFALPVAIAELAPGSEVVMVDASARTQEKMRRTLLGFGKAATVRAVDGDAAALARAGRDGFLIANAPQSSKGPAWELRLTAPVAGADDPGMFVADLAMSGRLGTPIMDAPLQLIWALGDDGVVIVFDARLLPPELARTGEDAA